MFSNSNLPFTNSLLLSQLTTQPNDQHSSLVSPFKQDSEEDTEQERHFEGAFSSSLSYSKGIKSQISDVEFSTLKQKMTEIEFIASTRIRVLTQQLDRQTNINRKLEKELKNVGMCEKREMSVNTERDERDQEIEALREALMRHVRMNRHLLSRVHEQTNKENISCLFNNIEL